LCLSRWSNSMRSGFGRYAVELRSLRGITQTEFAAKVGMSLSRISNIEYQRASVSDDVIGAYIAALNCNGSEALELRKRASFSNRVKRGAEDGAQHPPLSALLDQFGDRISPTALAEIQKVLERETGEKISVLAFSSNQRVKKRTASKRKQTRPTLLPKRFVEICLLAFEVRSYICNEMSKVDIGRALEVISTRSDNFDYRVTERLPSFAEGAFALIVGEADGHTVVVEEKRFVSALNGVHFTRHAIGHEIGHHYLHSDLLASDSFAILAVQELAKNSCDMIGSDQQIQQVVDSIVEVEAELFATMLLVPWTAFIKGTSVSYLASDYGEQIDEVKRYALFFKNGAVIDAFKSALWALGQRRHVIFSLN
jgi:transcriptional regulator with XRE-family HTH domain